MNSTPPSSKAFFLLPLLKEANLPYFEAYDKLMRYQTSLNNQLSKQIGELMELEKRYAK